MTETLTLRLSCHDRPGLVAKVAGFLAAEGGNIVDAQQFDDRLTGRFFMRVIFEIEKSAETVRAAFAPLAEAIDAEWTLRGAGERQRVLLLVSKFDHCLADLIYRWRIGELPMEITAIVSNHAREHIASTDLGDLPFHHMPINRQTKMEQEAELWRLIQERVG